MSFRAGQFRPAALRLVAKAPPPDDPPLGFGDQCRVISGGPEMLVVDFDDVAVIAAWHDSSGIAREHCFLRASVRRIR